MGFRGVRFSVFGVVFVCYRLRRVYGVIERFFVGKVSGRWWLSVSLRCLAKMELVGEMCRGGRRFFFGFRIFVL